MRTVYRDLVWQCEEKIRLGWPGLRPEDPISIEALESEIWSGSRKGRVTGCFGSGFHQDNEFLTSIRFLVIIYRPVYFLKKKKTSCLFFKTQRFGDWILSPSSVKSTQLGPVDRASPYLRNVVLKNKQNDG
jgi:hypothetical protein